MQRFYAIITLTAFLLVITMPMLPVAPACAHSMMGNDDTCETACHDESPVLMPDDMDMSALEMEMEPAHEHQQVVAKQEAISDKPPLCRIECGCGCNSSPDTFPLTLSPHLPAINFYDIKTIQSEVATITVPHKSIALASPDSPPPRIN